MLALWIILGSIGYLTVGRAYGKATWETWSQGDRTSLRAKFFFPLSSGDQEYFGRFNTNTNRFGFFLIVDGTADTLKNKSKFATLTTFAWPLFLGTCVLTFVLVSTSKFVFIRLPEALSNGPSVAANSVRRLLTRLSQKELSAPELALTTDATSPEYEYLHIVRRRQELIVEMDALTLREADAVAKIGGPDEAMKLGTLPNKIL
jgi:hypothetical protein